ncbi:MAG: hypothetical protein OXC00_13640 [Acidimicrobiaceae bacterium]|nr:hypothetical protein [Acidimicrobiaceae bacterium]
MGRATAPGRASFGDAGRPAWLDARRGQSPQAIAEAVGGAGPPASVLPGVSSMVDRRGRSARAQARSFGTEPVRRSDFRSGVRAMRDGIALAEVTEANRLEAALTDPSGQRSGGSGTVDLSNLSPAFAPLERSTAQASVEAVGAGRTGFGGAAGDVPAGVWQAAERGTDVARGGWYGWNVNGEPCPTGTACATAMSAALTAAAGYAIPGNFNCGSNVGYVGPFCLFKLFEKRNQLREELRRWARTMQGWRAIEEYRAEVAGQVAGSSAPYDDWTSFDGVMPTVDDVSYVTAGTGIALTNPVCVLPPFGNPLPLHGVEEQFGPCRYADAKRGQLGLDLERFRHPPGRRGRDGRRRVAAGRRIGRP